MIAGDGMVTQRNLSRQITGVQGHYDGIVKDNQSPISPLAYYFKSSGIHSGYISVMVNYPQFSCHPPFNRPDEEALNVRSLPYYFGFETA